MKTLKTLILLAALTFSGINATIAGADQNLPDYYQLSSASVDTLGSITFPAELLPIAPEEEYINDIPFDTKKVSSGYFVANMPKPEKETEFNDIPFDTKSVSDRYLNIPVSGVGPDPESYINDIPCNTACIAKRFTGNCNPAVCH